MIKERRVEKYMLALTVTERRLLGQIAEAEHIPMSAVIRRWIWKDAEKLNLITHLDRQISPDP